MAAPDLLALLASMTAEQRKGALVALDALTRPLSAREIEHALRDKGVPKPRAIILANSVRKLNIVALVGGETGAGKQTSQPPTRKPPPSHKPHIRCPGSSRARGGSE